MTRRGMERGFDKEEGARRPRTGSAFHRASLFLLVFLLLSGLPAVPARAQGFDLTVSPVKTELTVDPGEGMDFPITLINHSYQDQELLVYSMDFSINPDNSYEFHEPGYYTYSCSRWITIPRERLVIPARTQHEEVFRLEVPPDAEPGGHFSVLFFQDAAEPPPGEGVKPTYRVGSLILLTVPGEIEREAEIKSFSVESDFLSLWGPPEEGRAGWPARDMRYRVEVENTGNVHLTVKGFLNYRPLAGFGAASLELGEMTVLPGSVRTFEGRLPSPPALGLFRAEAVISYGPDMYTFDTEKRAEGKFWVFPLLWFLLLVLLAVGVWYLARFLRGRYGVSIKVTRRR